VSHRRNCAARKAKGQSVGAPACHQDRFPREERMRGDERFRLSCRAVNWVRTPYLILFIKALDELVPDMIFAPLGIYRQIIFGTKQLEI
jgi:hypothetical protein